MRPEGVLYKNGKPLHGELRVSLSPRELKLFKYVRLIGASLASFSLTALLFFWGPAFLENFSFNKVNQESTVYADEPWSEESPIPSSSPKPVVTSVSKFNISIPSINASSEVIHNVDPFNKEEYLSALKVGVAHAQGTGLPGEGKRIYLFAHSTNSPLAFSQFNAVFYELKDVSEGDLITVVLNDTEYKYTVKEKRVVEATDISWLTEKTSEESLVLQTCDPPGTTLRRLLVIAKRV